jgi:two-component system chemotaxis response regulator CheY
MTLRTVIVDPNAVARGLLATVLADGGYEVVGTTHSGPQGLALAIRHAPHFICLADEQAGDHGELIGQLREQAPKTLVFMVSATLDADSVQAALARGAHGFIVKPFKADAVLKAIRNTVLAVVRRQQA